MQGFMTVGRASARDSFLAKTRLQVALNSLIHSLHEHARAIFSFVLEGSDCLAGQSPETPAHGIALSLDRGSSGCGSGVFLIWPGAT